MTAAIRMDLLGGFQVRTPDGVIIPISSKKGRALLAYLALQGRAQTREKVCGLLWSAREQAHAQNSLRHELVELRRAFAAVHPAPLVIDGDEIGFADSLVATDVAEFERCARAGTTEALQSAASLYRGALLDGLAVRDSMFEEWLAWQRERLHEVAIELFDRMTADSAGASKVAAAQQLLALDPLREASHRALMQAFAERGETDLALRQFEVCRGVLREELDVDPAVETEQLRQDIRNGRLRPSGSYAAVPVSSPASKNPAVPGKALLAVVPFEVVRGDSDLDGLAGGLSEDIVTGLARFRLVSVLSRHMTLPFKGHVAELGRLRDELGANYALAGSLRQSGDRVRATAQLVETERGRELWAERYDRHLGDSFALQDELSQAIVAGVEHILVAAEHRRALASGLDDHRILNQKAGWHLFRFTRTDSAKAIELLRLAVAQNPAADRRCQALALALGLDLAFGWAERPQETIEEMVAAAERGVSLGEPDAWNHAPLCWSLMYSRQFDRAIAGLKRMIELNPNSGVPYGVGAVVLGHCGRPETALELLAMSRRMAPQAPFMFNYLCGGALALYRLGRFADAVEMAESSALRRPNYFQPQMFLAAALVGAGDIPRAREALAAARRIAPAIAVPWLRPLIPLRSADDFALLTTHLGEAGLDD